MSSNVLKSHMFEQRKGESFARIIDSNEIVNKRLQELSAKISKEAENSDFTDEFSEGIVAEDVTSLLFQEDENADDTSSEELIENARQKAEEIILDAKRQAEDVVQNSIAQAEVARQEVMEQAKEMGYQAGKQEAMAELQRLRASDEERVQQIEQEFLQKADGLEKILVDQITDIYSYIFQVDLEEYKGVLIYLIKSTLRGVNSSKQIIIRVSSDDFSYVNGHRKLIMEQLPSTSLTFEILEDLNLHPRQCMIETESGIFDCGIDTQLYQLRKKLTLLSYDPKES